MTVMGTWYRSEEEEHVDWDPERGYTQSELNRLADQVLQGHAASSVDCTCPPPWERPEDYKCQCSGPRRTIGGDDPILFADHERQRRKREIYCEAGTPDPSLVQGMYNKSHPKGRKINSIEQRRANGASYYK